MVPTSLVIVGAAEFMAADDGDDEAEDYLGAACCELEDVADATERRTFFKPGVWSHRS